MSFIHQELAFVPGMTVLENIMLGLPKKTRFGIVDWRAIAQDVAPIADRVGVKAPLGANAKGLSTAENWLINITRALVRKARLIVMDEPTAALSAAESERLFGIIRDLRQSGVAVLYVSHRLDEILDLCQRVTVFRDGRSVAELAGAGPDARRRWSRRSSAAPSKTPRSATSADLDGEIVLCPRARLPRAESQRRELRSAYGRSARTWRPRRRRKHGAGAAPLRRRPAASRRDDCSKASLMRRAAPPTRSGPGSALCPKSGGPRV